MVPDAQAADAQLMLLYLGFLCDETDFVEDVGKAVRMRGFVSCFP